MAELNPLLERILSGESRQLQLLAAQGMVPLAPEELIPIQIALTGSPDGEVSRAAEATLSGIDEGVATTFVRQTAGARELLWFGRSGRAPLVDEVIRRRDVPLDVLETIAPELAPQQQETLALRQDAILEAPEILVALERNESLSNYAKRRIWEYREHLLPRDKVPPKSSAEILAEVESLSDNEIAEAVAEVRERVQGEDDDTVVDDRTGLNSAQVRMLPVPMRVKLARSADRQMRMLLTRDSNSMVAVACITANSVPDSEVEQYANSRAIHEDVLKEIPKRREWIRKYSIARALVKNPKTPLNISMKLVPRMTVRDLRDLAKDKNVPEGVRQNALRLYQAKR